MPKIVVLYTKPQDTDAFEQHYRDTHRKLASAVPGSSWEVTRMTGTPRGGEPAYHLMAVATFPSEAALQAGLTSPEMRATGKDAAQMVQRFGNEATMLLGTDFA